MKKLITSAIFSLFILTVGSAQQNTSNFVTYDIDNFWTAYDKITATRDSTLQYSYINSLFIEKGSPGLKAIMGAKRYTSRSYIDAINNYPQFWNSIRLNTLKAKGFASDIAADITKLKALYPELKPASIYFTIGALRTGGTTRGNMVLIGSEIALGDRNTVTKELPKDYDNLKTVFATDPINLIVFTNVHEYVHTQQKTTDADNLLGQSVLEGVAEFMAVKTTGQPSSAPAINYGKAHEEKVKQKFALQMFNPFTLFWLYSNGENEFGVRDLGYYVGYAICEKYYDKTTDKKLAIKNMIELDYNNENELNEFVDRSGYFAKPVSTFGDAYEETRPGVTAIEPFKNADSAVDPTITHITIHFSAEMNTQYRNFKLGPLGKDNLLHVKKFDGFSADGKSTTFEVELKPNQRYQVILGEGFRDKEGIAMKPYLIDFKTADK